MSGLAFATFARADAPEGVRLLSRFSGVSKSVLKASPKSVAALRSTTDSEAPESAVIEYQALKNLPHVATLRYSLPESVCEPDERTLVTDTTQVPFVSNCLLLIKVPGGSARGTGWLAGPRLVVTAGHCVHEGAGGDFFTEIEVIPGAFVEKVNGVDVLRKPFGSKKIAASKLRTTEEWKATGQVARDYGALLLPEEFRRSNGGALETIDFGVVSDSALITSELTVSGYPGDKPTGMQWQNSGVPVDVQPDRLHYMIDTYGGESGSAVTRKVSGKVQAVGIHNYGGCPNKCTRITAAVETNLKKWRDESTAH